MDIDISEIEKRIKDQFALGHGTLFWEDEPGEYSEIASSLDLGDGMLVDVTGSELASKRILLRARPARNMVVYRCGERPLPQDDFLYDVKLASTPFSCKMEGVWASECGVPAELAAALAEHARFFNSKERRERLAATSLPKGTLAELETALLACCTSSKSGNPRDAVRDVAKRLVVEFARGKSSTVRTIEECGLAAHLWSSVESVFGYSVPEGGVPNVEDLAFRMLQTRCADLMPETLELLSADAVKVLEEMASNSRTREAYDALVSRFHESIASMIGQENCTAASIKDQDALPDFDEWILLDMLSRIKVGSLRSAEAEDILNMRKHTLWFERFSRHYSCLSSAVAILEAIEGYKVSSVSKTDGKSLFDAYCGGWNSIDAAYRHFVEALHAVPNGSFKRAIESLRARVSSAYDGFLVDLTDRWQLHLLDEGTYPPASIPSQDGFFHEKVRKSFPVAKAGRRIGVVVSDALRYEVGAELASRLNLGVLAGIKGAMDASCEGMLCMLPSYTQLGMAALLPEGDMEIVPETENVLKAGVPTNGLANRQDIVASAVPGAIALQASEVLGSGLPDVESAPLVVVYHNVIDERGDNRSTEGDVFAACEDAIRQIARIVGELLAAGCGKVLVTSDHGFIYQDHPVADYDYAVVKGLNDLASSDARQVSRTRRFAIGNVLPKSDMLIEYSAADLSLDGEALIGLAKGITRLRLRGSGARYVHGGASLQENAIPLVTVTPVKKSLGAAQTGVQGFLHGRAVITGPTVTLDVYQTLACSDKVASLTVKVGLYDPSDAGRVLSASEQTLELASTSKNSEDRKTRVTLHVTNDVDSCDEAVLRISARIGKTNQYRPEWEETLSVNRAFGNDFDF